MFLDAGADPNCVSKNSQAPLHYGYDVWISSSLDPIKRLVALDVAKKVIKLLLNVSALTLQSESQYAFLRAWMYE